MEDDRTTNEMSNSFVRRVSAFARKSRGRTKKDVQSPTTNASTSVPVPRDRSTAFVNHGLEFFNQQRAEWTSEAQRKVVRTNQTDATNVEENEPAAEFVNERPVPEIDEDELAELIYTELSNPSYTEFPRPVPMRYLVEVLLDVWDQEGII